MADVQLSTLGSVIKTAYEGEADTNAFTDDEQTKLTGIEESATADQTAAEILTALLTVDGSGTGLDADLLDGAEASSFVTTAGDELVSAQANNDLTANPKFWVGTQGEYDGLTPTAGELYFILA